MDHWRYKRDDIHHSPEPPLVIRPPSPKLIRVTRTLQVPEQYSYPPDFKAGESERLSILNKCLLDVYGEIGRRINDHSYSTSHYDANINICDGYQNQRLNDAVKKSVQLLDENIQKALYLLAEIDSIGGCTYIPPELAQKVVFDKSVPTGSLAHLAHPNSYFPEHEYPLPPGVLVCHNEVENYVGHYNLVLRRYYEKLACNYNRMNFLVSWCDESRNGFYYEDLYEKLWATYDHVFGTLRHVQLYQEVLNDPAKGEIFSFPVSLQEAVEEMLSKEPTSSSWMEKKAHRELEAKLSEERKLKEKEKEKEKLERCRRQSLQQEQQRQEVRRQQEEARKLQEEARKLREEGPMNKAKPPHKKQKVLQIFTTGSDDKFSEDDSDADSKEPANTLKKEALVHSFEKQAPILSVQGKKAKPQPKKQKVWPVSSSESDDIQGKKAKPQPKKHKVWPVSSSESDDESSEYESDAKSEKPAKVPIEELITYVAQKLIATKKDRTLHMGNVPQKAEFGDVQNFFKDAGKVVDVRFPIHDDGSRKGYCFVEFNTVADAAKALRDNQSKKLLGFQIVLGLAKQRSAQTTHSSNLGCSQKPAPDICNSIFIRGFDKYLAEDKIRSSLKQHFGECGEIAKVSIPTDHVTGVIRGFAFLEFKDENSVSKALKLNGSEIGGGKRLHVAKAGNDQNDGGGRFGDHSGGRRGGGRFCDRSGGRDGGRGHGGGARSFGSM